MPGMDTLFEERYQQWKSFINIGTLSLSSFSDDYINNEQFQSIVDLGPEAIPFIIEKMKTDEDAHFLVHALERIKNG
jgi:ATP-dependent helicase/DNAse subunit B